MRYENNPDICKLEAGRYMAAIISYITSGTSYLLMRIKNKIYLHTVYPYFNQTQGIDHVIVQTWDQSSEVYGWNSDSWRLLNKNLIRLSTLGYAGIHVNFNVYKDIVIPPYINFDDIESWLSNLSDTHNESDQLLGRRSMAYFRGTIIRDFAYSHGVRQYISQNLSEKYLHDPRRYQIYEGNNFSVSV
jgi:hypothetical protein